MASGVARDERLADFLSNLRPPLVRLIETVARTSTPPAQPAAPAEADPAVAKEVKENRILSPDEVTELVEAYLRGATLRDLSQRYGVHRHTIDRHLERAGVTKRPMVKMTAARVARATELYKQGWSTNQIGRELHVDGSTVWKALKRAGVQMRPPVA